MKERWTDTSLGSQLYFHEDCRACLASDNVGTVLRNVLAHHATVRWLSLHGASDDPSDHDEQYHDGSRASAFCQSCLDEASQMPSNVTGFLHACAVCMQSPKIRRNSKHRVSWHVAGLCLNMTGMQAPKLDRHSKYAAPEPEPDCLDCGKDVNAFLATWQEFFGTPQDAVPIAPNKCKPAAAAVGGRTTSKANPRAFKLASSKRVLRGIGAALAIFVGGLFW
ncbi:hypothetical protein OEZ85_004864 [Tetradesmus obliquus]|uniref:Uncharacterized protein n=1 Tax=Tetradesmus obliquus TaxID=3088 RepID=A0ABY8UGI9_TETOB|nr:hypothetical protein OEZ85_004864 [Tetradesmus obliquus]